MAERAGEASGAKPTAMRAAKRERGRETRREAPQEIDGRLEPASKIEPQKCDESKARYERQVRRASKGDKSNQTKCTKHARKEEDNA